MLILRLGSTLKTGDVGFNVGAHVMRKAKEGQTNLLYILGGITSKGVY